MKTKILLFVSLVLLAVQGWAMPMNSLTTYATGLIPNGDGFDATQTTVNLANNLIQTSQNSINPKKGDVLGDAGGTGFPIVDNLVSTIDIIHVNKSVTFHNVPVGASVTKEFEVSSDNAYRVAEEYRKIHNLLREDTDPYIAYAKIKVKISPSNIIPGGNLIDGLIGYLSQRYKRIFSLDTDLLDPLDLCDGKIIKLTYKPDKEREDNYKFVLSYKFYDQNGDVVPTLFNLAPIIQVSGLARDMASAVDGHIITSEKLLSFSNLTVGKGKSETRSIHVTGINLSGPLKLEFDPNNDGNGMFSFDKDRITVDEAENGGTDVMITYFPTSKGSHEATIVISEEGSPENVKLKLSGNAYERHITTSGTLSFPTLIVGESKTLSINISGTNLNGSLIVDLSSETGMFHLDRESNVITADEAEADGGTDIYVTYNPTSAGTHKGSITISGGDAIEEPIILDFDGHCEAPAHIITVDPTELNFSTVVVGSTPPSKSFTVRGTKLTNDLVLSLPPECSHYTVSPARITPDDAADGEEVTVTYHPSATGTHNITLKIDEEGTNNEQLVSLLGKCIENPTITVNPTSLDFETIEVGQEKPMTINVTGTDLTGLISVTKEETHGGQFSISRETLNASGGSVIVTFKPTEAGSFGGCVRISGGGASPVSVTLNGSARELRVTKSSLDFGTIKKNETSPKKFTVYGDNLLGNVTLISSNKNLFEVIPETITPAEAKAGKEVTVTYKPTAGGTHSGKIIVSSEGVTNKEVAISGKCAEIKVNKTSLDFKTIEVGNDTTITINVTGSNVTGSITVKKQETHGGQFTISRETLPSTGGNVVVTFKPTEAGSFGGSISISGEGADPISVSLTGKALELSVYPSSLNLGTTYKNGTLTKKFTVYGGNLTDDVTLSSNKTVFDVSPKKITPAEAKAGKEVTVTFKPTTGGSYSGEITVSASGVAPKKISVSGKCAVITSNPTSYDFGNVAVSKPVTKVITITGTNLTGAMSITLAETEGGQYSINKTTLPASGGTVIVTFKPTDAKTFGASLKISGGNAAAVSVSLTGKGVTPTITKNKSTLTFTGSSITSDYVKVTGTNLDDIISLTVTGSTNFTVSPSTISISDAVDGKQVKVTCNPKNASSAEAKLKISSPYASTKYVTLKYSRGSSGGGETQICSVEPDDEQEDEVKTGEFEVTNLAFGASTSDVDELSMSSKIYADGQNIVIESPEEQNALISDLAGRARNVSLQVGRNEIPVNASGIYIVRIREKTTKLIIK